MKTLGVIAGAVMMASSLFAQDKIKLGAYELTPIVENESTAVKDQNRTGTCWCFGTVAMLESDFIKAGKGSHDISEMWIVRHTYYNKVVRYVRMHGRQNMAQGGYQHDAINISRDFGIVPEEAYPGLNYGEDAHVHGEIEKVLQSFAKTIVSNPNRKLTTAWKDALNGILDAYFGVRPEKFNYQGKEYTPQSFAKSLDFNASDYVLISSFNHAPFYTYFTLEVPDNWTAAPVYNIPFEQFNDLAYSVIDNGYTICWDADIDKGFKHSIGLALYPDVDVKNMTNSERGKWDQMSVKEKASIYSYKEIVKEKAVTAEEHQEMFDNYDTTDDHLMQLCAIYKDQNGTIFYKTKNSWNTDNSAGEGYLYTSKNYIRAKTVSFMFNKKALSSKMLKELKLVK